MQKIMVSEKGDNPGKTKKWDEWRIYIVVITCQHKYIGVKKLNMLDCWVTVTG